MTLQDWLATPVIVALPDRHRGDGLARLKADALLREPGLVKIFFFEYESTAHTHDRVLQQDYGRSLNGAISEILDRGASRATALRALPDYMPRLALLDARPNLNELVATAVGNGVQALAADRDYAEVRDLLAAAGLSEINMGYEPGMRLRDPSVSRMVAGYLAAANGAGAGRLMLWGEGHFTEAAADPAANLCDARLQVLLAQRGLPVHVATPQEMAL